MKMLLLDIDKQILTEVEAACYEDYYRLLDCDMVGIPMVQIAGKTFNVIANDNASMKMDQRISAIDKEGNVMFMGNLLITGEDNEAGELTGLSDDDVAYIKRFCRRIPTSRFPKGTLMLVNVSR